MRNLFQGCHFFAIKFVVILYFLLLTSYFLPNSAVAASPRLCIENSCYVIETVRTSADRERGLMFRTGLLPDHGMFFIFDEPAEHSFWMKNMKFPIDILWIDQDMKVVHVESNVPPCAEEDCPAYGPLAMSVYVLEIPAGDAVRKGLRLGAVARLE